MSFFFFTLFPSPSDLYNLTNSFILIETLWIRFFEQPKCVFWIIFLVNSQIKKNYAESISIFELMFSFTS